MTSPGSLDCPEPENYAAVALQMQETALQVESRLYDVEQSLRAAANRQTFVQTTTAARTGLAAGQVNSITPGFVANVITFSNWPGFSGISFQVPQFPGDGLYEVGFYINAIASGAVTDNSYRIAKIRHIRPVPGSGTPITVDTAQATVFEANVGGGMDITVSGTFNFNATDQYAMEFEHGNVGSTMNISIGAVYWFTYLGSRQTVEVF